MKKGSIVRKKGFGDGYEYLVISDVCETTKEGDAKIVTCCDSNGSFFKTKADRLEFISDKAVVNIHENIWRGLGPGLVIAENGLIESSHGEMADFPWWSSVHDLEPVRRFEGLEGVYKHNGDKIKVDNNCIYGDHFAFSFEFSTMKFYFIYKGHHYRSSFFFDDDMKQKIIDIVFSDNPTKFIDAFMLCYHYVLKDVVLNGLKNL